MSHAALVQCTFVGNSAPDGSNISADCDGHITADACIVTGGAGSAGVYVNGGSSAVFTCTDIWGNPNGDWVEPFADQLGQDGNLSADPAFCNPNDLDFTISASSPCAPDQHPECGLIGAWPVGCAWPADIPGSTVATLTLAPNVPNPFNPTTTIRFELPTAATALLSIHTLDGRLVCRIVDDWLPAGTHDVQWHGYDRAGRSMPSGVYLYRLQVGVQSVARRLTLVR